MKGTRKLLILTRKIDQSIRLYDQHGTYLGLIMVLGVERDRVKLGISAPRYTTILRSELLDEAKIEQEKELEKVWATLN